MNNIYVYTIVAQQGNSPIHRVGNHDTYSAATPLAEKPSLLGRETTLIAAQAIELTALLLKHVSIAHRQNMGLFVGTRFGSLEDDRMFQKSRLADGGKFASPAAFRRTLPSTVPAELSIAFGIRGPLITFADAATPAMIAIIRAYHWIATGGISAAVAGSLDFLLSDDTVSPAASPICRTLLCLMATAEAFPELTPWAAITQASIQATGQSAGNAPASLDETDFTEIITAMTASHLTMRSLHRQSGSGNICNLVLRPGKQGHER